MALRGCQPSSWLAALTGAHLLRKCPAWVNTARLCLPRPDQRGQAGCAEALGLRPPQGHSLSTPTWPRLAAPTGMASWKPRKEERGAGVGARHRTRPTSQVTSSNPSLLGPGSLPPPTVPPLPTLTHVKPSATLAPLAGTTACDSAPSPEAALWVAAPETLVGREPELGGRGEGWREKTCADPRWPFPDHQPLTTLPSSGS